MNHQTTSNCLTIDNDTTVGVESLTGNAGAVAACKEDEASSNLGRLTWSTNWRCELLKGLVAHGRWSQRSPDWTWSDCVAANALVTVLVGQATSEGDDGTLGASVVEQIWAADVGVDRGAVDDGVAVLHLGNDVLGQVVVWVDVGLEGEVPLVFWELLDVCSLHLNRSVVDQDVNMTKGFLGCLGDLLAVLSLGNVNSKGVDLGSVLLGLLLAVLGVLLFLRKVDNQDVGSSLHGEQDCGGTANTTVTTSDDSVLALELACSLVELLSAVRSWEIVVDGVRAHVILFAWPWLVLNLWLVACIACQ